jgi:cell fate regulator YaaT (PSP1 superfamily)
MKEVNMEMAIEEKQYNEYDASSPDLKVPDSEEGSKDELSIVLVAVRFRPKWPPSHYNAGNISLMDAEWVVVPTDHGIEVGQVMGRSVIIKMPLKTPLPKVERLASTHEIELYYRNLDREKVARDVCAERVHALGLSMKLVRVESFFDGSKVIFYYSAEGRVDFRELVKDLVKILRTRVEMCQIGIRHETKMIGGIGNCGREFCCTSFFNDFDPVSIKMAKTQNLPLNPSKISGICGRLLCCLTYEYGTYLDSAKDMPLIGKSCDTPAGQGKVVRRDILRQTVTVAFPDGTQLEFKNSELEQHLSMQHKKAQPSNIDKRKQKPIKTDKPVANSPKQKRSEGRQGKEKKGPERSTDSQDNVGSSKGRTKGKNRHNKGKSVQSKAKKNK